MKLKESMEGMPLSERSRSPSEIVNRLQSMQWVATQVINGLHGAPFHWNGTEGDYNVAWAAQMGLHLVTETQIKKRGYRLKKGARPVGSRSFGAPISRQALLYVLECQAVKVEKAKERE
jgi:hypothetical protein